jgi:hypothetical protein
VETGSVSRIGSRSSFFGTSDSASGDRISVSSSTVSLNAALDQISSARASRVSKLADLYAGGRYNAPSAQVAKSLVTNAGAGEIE